MKSKRGVIGRFVVTFVATITIALILLGFVFINSMVTMAGEKGAGIVIYKEDKLGIKDGVGYMNNYAKLVEAKAISSLGFSLDDTISEVGYGK